jgi:hypothetical protein
MKDKENNLNKIWNNVNENDQANWITYCYALLKGKRIKNMPNQQNAADISFIFFII